MKTDSKINVILITCLVVDVEESHLNTTSQLRFPAAKGVGYWFISSEPLTGKAILIY